MRKLLISATLASAMGLGGCGGETIEDIKAEAKVQRPASRMVFDPSNGALPLPTDLLLALVKQTQDGTLEVPDEVAQGAAGEMPNYADPGVVLGALDGWSTQYPFSLSTTHPAGISLQAESLSVPGAVRIFKGSIGGDINDPDCATAPLLSGCKIEAELQFGKDFVTRANGNDISIIPLKPFEGATSYYIAVTDKLKSSDGQSVKSSTSYESLSADINTLPLSTASQLALQGLINSYEAVIATQGGVAQDSIIYAGTFTTQTTDSISHTVKGLQIGAFAQAVAGGMSPSEAGQFLPVIAVTEGATATAFEFIAPSLLGANALASLASVGLDTCDGLLAAMANPASPLFATASQTFAQVGAFCAADLKQGSINLPYYLSPSKPLTQSWNAACTNGLALQTIGADKIPGLIANGTVTVGANNDLCQAATSGRLLDLDLSNLGITDYRHLTRYSPIPQRKGRNPDGTETLAVQMTVPDAAVVNLIASIPGSSIAPVTKPENGWPVVILSHGITSKKEDFLAITGALSLAGFATVAIDHPLHGSRGFVMEDGTVINASAGLGGNTTHFFNLQSLLTFRDNGRQGVVDQLGLRLGLNAVVDMTGGSVQLDSSNVFFVGQSLGSMIGVGAVDGANTSLAAVNPALAAFDSMYQIKATSLAVPGGGVIGFLFDSPSFGPLVKGSILVQASTAFQQFVGQYAAENGMEFASAIPAAFATYAPQMSAQQMAEAATLFNEFGFVAQSVLDSADPVNYIGAIKNTPVHMLEQIGGGVNDDGSTALADQVIPNTAALPLSGTEPLAALMGLEGVSTTTPGKGLVRFTSGSHSSLLNPGPSAATTMEQQLQVANYFASTLLGQPMIVVTDESVVAN